MLAIAVGVALVIVVVLILGIGVWLRNRSREASFALGTALAEYRQAADGGPPVPGQPVAAVQYQAALDNHTYKALRALREAQEWRLSTIEAGEPTLEVEVSAAVA